MGRKRKYHYHRKLYINPETVRGVVVLAVFAIAGVLLLSLADLAGNFGRIINQYTALIFGWDYFLVPVVLIVSAAAALYPDRRFMTVFKIFGILLFFLSFNALINLVAFRNSVMTENKLVETGGLVGVLFQRILENSLNFWGALLVLSALVIVSLLLSFNASLRNVLDIHAKLLSPFWMLVKRCGFRHNRGEDEFNEEEDGYDEEYEEGVEENLEVEEAEQDEKFKAKEVKTVSRAKDISSLEETALTTRVQRKIEVPLDLLEYRSNKAKSGDVERNKVIIRETLAEFGIEVEMGEVSIGPTVTQYTMRPMRGVKLTRIVSLQNDLALALAAHPIRIEAPIPGKSLVGIEVPNQTVAIVSLRQLLESKQYLRQKSRLAFGLGKDVAGEIWISQLDRMPHLLIAGATGSGKSVCLHTIILSLLYANGPDDLKLIMIDPKRVELTSYEGVPHLLIPPITKIEDAVNALKWTIREMERRLDVLSKFGAKDIKGFNERSKDKMPYIVVMIDELADLMMGSGREVEACVVRIAQLARATGIHLVIATQRPSVDVITGTIKANFPGRIAFAVASQVDSRTILDMAGAEKLLGRGDMLFTNAELSKPKRLQGAYVSEHEIEQVVSFLKKNGEPDYNYGITERERSSGVFDGAEEDESLLDDAVQYILQAGKASTSMLQRRLRIGYSRAARLIDILEDKGVIGPQDGARPREVLIDSWPPEKEINGDDDLNSGVDEETELDEETTNEEEEQEGEAQNDDWNESGNENEWEDK